jgi:hypothetical protein
MKDYFQAMGISAVTMVVAQIIFWGSPLQLSNLILWVIIGMAFGAISQTLGLLFGDSEPEPTFLDKITDHPVVWIIEGTVTGLIVGTSMGSYTGSEMGGCMIGGIIALILSIVFVFKDSCVKGED